MKCDLHGTSWQEPPNHCPECQDELARFLEDQYYHHTKNFSEMAGKLMASGWCVRTTQVIEPHP